MRAPSVDELVTRPLLEAGQVWRATEAARNTFPRCVRMVTAVAVHYRRVLRDGSLGTSEMCSAAEFWTWIASHKAERIEA